jgi:hypothetical protein
MKHTLKYVYLHETQPFRFEETTDPLQLQKLPAFMKAESLLDPRFHNKPSVSPILSQIIQENDSRSFSPITYNSL